MSTLRTSFVLSFSGRLLAPLLLGSLALSSGCNEARSEQPPPTPDVPVRVVTVERATLDRPIRAVGRLQHKRLLSLAFKNGGTLRQLLVAEGATVKKGQRLALVDTTEITAQVAEARATVEKVDRDLQRMNHLTALQAATRNDADNARTAYDQAHASLAAALYNQSAAVLVAPEAGRIDKKLAEVGEQVAPGRPIYAMSGAAAGFVVRVGVVDRDLPGLALGQSATLSLDALPGRTFTATISEIATEPSATSGTFEVELRVPTIRDATLTAGMTAKAELHPTAGPRLPVVPLGAIIDADGLSAALYALAEDHGHSTVVRVPVELGAIIGDRATVVRGLKGGEQIVSEGASFVEPGRRVRPILAAADHGSNGKSDGTPTAVLQ